MSDPAVLHTQFEIAARNAPERIALWERDASITFAQLDARANDLAARLASAGLRGGFVGLHVERSIDYVVGVLGILKAGAAVVPLPPSYPRGRIEQILNFAALDAVVDSAAFPLDDAFDVRSVRIAAAASERAATLPLADASSQQAAYVLSSSGSTGHPKMIVRSHESFFHRLRWTWNEHPFRADEICVQKSHMTTTHAIYELFEPLLRGVSVRIIADEELRELGRFWTTLREHSVRRLLIVPSMLQASLDLPAFVMPPLDVLVLMGEYVSPAFAGRVIEACAPSTKVYSIYGSTEASSTLVCDVRASYQPGRELPLGAPISPDVRAVVLDESLAPVTPGDAGMLYIGGTALFSGYYRDPELTASVLIERDGAPLYRTQDRVRALANGELEFIGRVDDAVKVRGFRVDLGDVQRVLSAHPDVRQCVVLARTNAGGGSSLVAFVTPSGVVPAGVLEGARRELPSYMVPAAIVPIDVLPLTASGKVDRKRLLAEFDAQPLADDGAFRSETERVVARVWRDVLGHGRFDADSNFFEVGGTSLDVFAAVFHLGEKFSLAEGALPDVAIYQHSTLADLASHIDALREGRASASTRTPVLVTLKRATKPDLPPLFLVPSAGGTLGAYARVVAALKNGREVVGLRDPFLWGDRDPTAGFDTWVDTFVDAMLERQPHGPYHLAAYSSAGAFGYEIARRLRARGDEVALLALIDPLALDRATTRRYGHWALEARFNGKKWETLARTIGMARGLPIVRGFIGRATAPSNWAPTKAEFDQLATRARADCDHIRRVSALMELNTGLPLRISADEAAAAGPDGCLALLDAKLRDVAPGASVGHLENLIAQYELQVRAQHNYRLQPYDGAVCLFEPAGAYVGLEAAQIRPYVRKLRHWVLPVDTGRTATVIDGLFPETIKAHYLCMRDDVFVARLATELDALLAYRSCVTSR